MKILIQIVKEANVKVDNKIVNQIENGYLLFVGIEITDTKEIIEKMATKVANIRINKDNEGKTNLSLKDVGGKILSISQFTLCADSTSRRPSFTKAANKEMAINYYEYFNKLLENEGYEVKTGCFGKHMDVSLINDGPFTIILDSDKF